MESANSDGSYINCLKLSLAGRKQVLDKIALRFQEVVEAFREGGIKNLLQKRFFFNRTLMPCEMDLVALPEIENPLLENPYRMVPLTMKLVDDSNLEFAVRNRRLKAKCNLRKGLNAYALIKDNLVVGDIWCDCPSSLDEKVHHPDLDWLSIENKPGEVYAFDMFIDSNERGNNLAGPFMKSFLYVLKERGFRKTYGYYWCDYLPALWMHRLLKFKERGRLKTWQFLFVRGATPE
jgi:hypothetical protein